MTPTTIRHGSLRRFALFAAVLTLLLAYPPSTPEGEAQGLGRSAYIYVFSNGALLIEASGHVDGASSLYNYSSLNAEFRAVDNRILLEISSRRKVSLPARPGTVSLTSTWNNRFNYNYFSDGETLVIEAGGAKNTSEELVGAGYTLSRSEYRSIRVLAQKQSLEFHVNLNISLSSTVSEGQLKNLAELAENFDREYDWFTLVNYTYNTTTLPKEFSESLNIEYILDFGDIEAVRLLLLPLGVPDPSSLFTPGTARLRSETNGKVEQPGEEPSVLTLETSTYMRLEASLQVADNLRVSVGVVSLLMKNIIEPDIFTVATVQPGYGWVLAGPWASPSESAGMYLWAFSQQISGVEVLEGRGTLNVTIQGGTLSYTFRSPRFRPKYSADPRESLQLLPEKARDFAAFLRLLLVVEADASRIAQYLDTLPVKLKPGDAAVAEISPAETVLGKVGSVSIILDQRGTTTTTTTQTATGTCEPPSAAWSPLSLGLGALIGVIAGITLYAALARRRGAAGSAEG